MNSGVYEMNGKCCVVYNNGFNTDYIFDYCDHYDDRFNYRPYTNKQRFAGEMCQYSKAKTKKIIATLNRILKKKGVQNDG